MTFHRVCDLELEENIYQNTAAKNTNVIITSITSSLPEITSKIRLHHGLYLRDVFPLYMLSIIKKLAHYVVVSRHLIQQARQHSALSTMIIEMVRFQPIASQDSVPLVEDIQSLFVHQNPTLISCVLDRLVPSATNQTIKREVIARAACRSGLVLPCHLSVSGLNCDQT